MKKFILPLTVVVLAAGMQLTALNPSISVEKSATAKKAIGDVGTFNYLGINYEVYGESTTHTVSYLIDTQHGVQLQASGVYTPIGDQGTIRTSFTDYNNTHQAYSGVYYQ